MAPAAVPRVDLYPGVLEAMLNDIHGPVGKILRDVSDRMAMIAVANAPVNTRYSPFSTTQFPPGYTKVRTRMKVSYDTRGKLYGGVNAPHDPTVFLEKDPNGASQMDSKHPFLTTALWQTPGV